MRKFAYTVAFLAQIYPALGQSTEAVERFKRLQYPPRLSVDGSIVMLHIEKLERVIRYVDFVQEQLCNHYKGGCYSHPSSSVVCTSFNSVGEEGKALIAYATEVRQMLLLEERDKEKQARR